MVVNGWGSVLAYSACAISIVFAAGTLAMVLAAIGCSMLIAQTMDG